MAPDAASPERTPKKNYGGRVLWRPKVPESALAITVLWPTAMASEPSEDEFGPEPAVEPQRGAIRHDLQVGA